MMILLFKILLCMGPLGALLLLIEIACGRMTHYQRWVDTSAYQILIGLGMPFMWFIGLVGLIILR